VMPNGMDANIMMQCLCAVPPTCTRAGDMHNQAITPPPPPPPPATCHAGEQPNARGGCTPCGANMFGTDGRECVVCNQGHGVNAGHTSCDACVGETYSAIGTACIGCPANKSPNLAHTECETVATSGTSTQNHDGGTEDEDSIATAVVTEYQADGVAGYTTYRVAVRVGGDAVNVYTIFGNSDHPTDRHPMEIPGALQSGGAATTSNIGGVNPAFYSTDASVQYDSWLTVGATEGSEDISSIGIDFNTWNATAGLQVRTVDSDRRSWVCYLRLVCARARACVRACACACVCVRARARARA
jgi:hypothetical protein